MKRDAQSSSLARMRGSSFLRRLLILGLALVLTMSTAAAGIAHPGSAMIGSDDLSPRLFHATATEHMGKEFGRDGAAELGAAEVADHGSPAAPSGHGHGHGQTVGACCGIACHLAAPVDSAVAEIFIAPAIEPVRINGLVAAMDTIRIERPPRASTLLLA